MAKQRILLKDNDNELYPMASLITIDTDNLLASFDAGYSGNMLSYTATEDCFINLWGRANTSQYYLDDKFVFAPDGRSISVFLRKGQTLSARVDIHDIHSYYAVYGIKR